MKGPAEYPEFSWYRLGVALPIIGFAAGYSITIPQLTSNLIDKKRDALRAQFWSNVLIFMIVLLFGLIASYALLGTNSPSMTTLSWIDYDAGISPRPVWTNIIELIILIFPGLNVMTSSPLIALGVTGNYLEFIPNYSKRTEMLFRLVTWIPPAIIAFLTHDLGMVGAASGIPGYFVFFGFQAMLSLGLKAKVDMPSKYGGFFSHKSVAWT